MLCDPDLVVTTNANGLGDMPGKLPNDIMLSKQWAMDAINARGAWSAGSFGQVINHSFRVPCLIGALTGLAKSYLINNGDYLSEACAFALGIGLSL